MSNEQSDNKFLTLVFVAISAFAIGCVAYVIIGLHNVKHTTTKVVVNSATIEKPTYDYLKSVTIYFLHPEKSNSPEAKAREALRVQEFGEDVPEPTNRFYGSVGTGTVIGEKDGYLYLLTNKHICGDEPVDGESYITDKDNCYIKEDGLNRRRDNRGMKQVEYVSSAKKGVDLELWRIKKNELRNKIVVKGFSTVEIQESVFSVGNYLGFNYIYTEGTKAGYQPDGEELFNLPCTYGCSGSGIFNASGELVSVLYAGNGIPTSFPLIDAFDTAKVIAVEQKKVAEFLKANDLYGKE